MNEQMRIAVEGMDANLAARALKERLAKARTKDELTSIEDAAFFYAAKWKDHKERFLQIATDVSNKQLSPNAAGRKPEYDAREDARVFDLYQSYPERISIEDFREENGPIKNAYTLSELRKLIDRERKRRAGAIQKRRRSKGCQ